MGGLKKYMPVTFLTMFVGWLAISGVPLLSGFFSKDEILYRTFVASGLPDPLPKLLWAVGALTALLTAVYMTRLMVLTFWGKERFDTHPTGDHSDHHDDVHAQHGGVPRESPRSMVLPLIVLAIGAAVAGFIGVPEGLSGGVIPNYFEHFLEPSIAHAPEPYVATAPVQAAEDHSTEIILTIVSSIIALLGIGLGWTWFNRKPLWEPPKLLEDKYYVDEVYDATVVEPVKVGSTKLLWRIIDVKIIDGAVNGAGALASKIGDIFRSLQTGLARSYVALVVLGALIIIGYFVMR
jgi:NADH-quinone oxidoreductase subunit L